MTNKKDADARPGGMTTEKAAMVPNLDRHAQIGQTAEARISYDLFRRRAVQERRGCPLRGHDG